ncbi:transposable element Tc1 transposase [Trichonephila clavipes]|nr:transposable element Tc1 transposase [Trichonephila clavipes]
MGFIDFENNFDSCIWHPGASAKYGYDLPRVPVTDICYYSHAGIEPQLRLNSNPPSLIVSRLWRQFQTTGTAIRGFSSGCPRGTTPTVDRYIFLQARRNRRQTAGEISRHTTQAPGRPILRFTVARRLHGGGLFARRPVRCVPLTPVHRRRRSLWCREHRNWRDNEWGRVLFPDESRFSLSSDSHRILIWRERGSRNHPSNIIKRGRRLAAHTLPPVTIRELRLALQDEWATMPQQLIDNLILSMGRRCETCLAVRENRIPY